MTRPAVLSVLLLGLLPVSAGATTYRIEEFTQTSGASTFFDPFNMAGGTPPPAGPFSANDYFTFGTFLSTDELDGGLDLVTGRGDVETGGDEREIGAEVANSTYFLSVAPAATVRGLFRNLAPPLGEGYGIFIEPVSDLVNDDASLIVFNSGGKLVAVFLDEGDVAITEMDLTGLDGMGTIELKLEKAADSNVVTAFIGTTSLGTTTLQDLSTGPYTGGFDAFEPVPEPGTLLLLGSGILGAAGYGWRWQRKKEEPR